MISSQNKVKYAFILGQVPALSKAEIMAILEHANLDFEELFYNEQVLVMAMRRLDVDWLQARLGGTIKIASLKFQASSINQEIIEKLIQQQPPAKNKRFQFGFSAYGRVNMKELKQIGLNLKRVLRLKKVRSRFVVSKESALSSVIVHKEKLIDQGADVVVINSGKEYYLGYTVSAQKFQEYSERDYGRPQRDDQSGMLPPKLAKMMINLGRAGFDQTILDPFCGSGTVIQEALLLGYKKIIGSDIAAKAVSDTINNLEWLKVKLQQDIAGVKIFQQDVKSLSAKIQPQSVDVIVTEPYLGPARAIPSSQDAKYLPVRPAGQKISTSKSQVSNPEIDVIDELSKLYLKAFAQFHQVLKKEGKAVIILPIINNQTVDIINDVKCLGFVSLPLSDCPRKSIVYARPGQRVRREIFVFKKI